MSFATFLINLDRASDRLQRMDANLRRLGIAYTRVPAVLGDLLEEPIANFDELGFRIRTGKHRNKREIGCYFSHLKVLEAFLATDHQHALVLEDDAELPDHFVDLLESAIAASRHWDLLRLSSSRDGGYLPLQDLGHGHQLAINTRVLKNTAAYMVNRRAAQRILDTLQPMRLPYDVALDRDWTMGIRSACILPFPVTLADVPGQIPKAKRSRFFRATTFHLLHLIDHFRRRHYRNRCAREADATPPG